MKTKDRINEQVEKWTNTITDCMLRNFVNEEICDTKRMEGKISIFNASEGTVPALQIAFTPNSTFVWMASEQREIEHYFNAEYDFMVTVADKQSDRVQTHVSFTMNIDPSQQKLHKFKTIDEDGIEHEAEILAVSRIDAMRKMWMKSEGMMGRFASERDMDMFNRVFNKY